MHTTKIEKAAEDFRQELKLKGVPVDLEKAAKKLNIKIRRAPSEDFSGLLIRKDGRALIGINDSESHVRQRFTLAHELAHFRLHPTKDAFVDYRDNQTGVARNKKEREANLFAACLLMPREKLIADVQKVSSKGIYEAEIQELAQKYDVSGEAMNYRLINLKIVTT